MRPQGLSIVEVIVAMAILAIVMAGVLPGFIGNLQVNSRTELRGTAISIAQEELERLRQEDLLNPTPAFPRQRNVSVDGRTFLVVSRLCVNTAYCSGASRHVQVQVSYQGSQVYAAETIYTRLSQQIRSRPNP